MSQSPFSVMMVSPDHFGFNPETAATNAFQKESLLCESHHTKEMALAEFNNLVDLLRNHGIEVLVFPSPKGSQSPDAVFPNNWISFHEDGKVIVYPLLTQNRRSERRTEIIDELKKQFFISEVIDLSGEEKEGRILEGTGSIVFDRMNMVAYANASARTNKHLFYDVSEMMGYEAIFFKATDNKGLNIYHTNVLLTIGEGFAVVCREVIDRAWAPEVINTLHGSGLEVIEITIDQMHHFAGNMIQVQNRAGKKYLVMSKAAFDILTENQKNRLSKYVDLIYSDIHTIESVGGGSARCMIAAIHLPRK